MEDPKMKSQLVALRQKKHDLGVRGRAILDRAKIDGRDMTASESSEWSNVIASLHATEAALITAEAQREQDLRMPAFADDNAMFARRAAGGAWVNPNAGDHHDGPATGRAGKGFRNLFGPNASNGGFESLGAFFKSFHATPHSFDPRLMAATTVEGTPSSGGFLVPEEWAQEILSRALEASIVLPRAQQWNMGNSDVKHIPGIDGFTHSSNLFGGFAAAWTAEAAPMTPQDLKSYLFTLNARKLAILGQVSNEMLDDAVQSFESVYGNSLIAATAWFLDYAFLNGDGSGKPLGLLNDSALITISKEGSQAADSIVYENVVKMWARLHPACAANAIWIANSTCIPQLLLMKNVVKNVAGTENVGGSAVPIVTSEGGKLYMMGREVVCTEKTPAVGSPGDLILTDLSQYAVGMRKMMALEKSIHPGFASDTTYFRVVTRCDGGGVWKSVMTPKVGDTLSWVVIIEDR
jgi:HK97 family phage major capsid protein